MALDEPFTEYGLLADVSNVLRMTPGYAFTCDLKHVPMMASLYAPADVVFQPSTFCDERGRRPSTRPINGDCWKEVVAESEHSVNIPFSPSTEPANCRW